MDKVKVFSETRPELLEDKFANYMAEHPSWEADKVAFNVSQGATALLYSAVVVFKPRSGASTATSYARKASGVPS